MTRAIALSGGVGGAKMVTGLAAALAPGDLLAVANTGDDFTHLGLHVCPDLDSVMYALAGIDNRETGWGIVDESWKFMDALQRLGGEDWFRLGDGDLATHVLRSQRLRSGERLSSVTTALCAALGVRHALAPMSDDPVRTIVRCDDEELPFQRYFVQRRCLPRVRGFRYRGAETARPSAALMAALGGEALAAVVLCPSNPYVSIDPILSIPGVSAALRACPAPVVAVSPIVGGRALKGPAAKMMQELGVPVNVLGIAAHYGDLLDGLVIDHADAALRSQLPGRLAVHVSDTVMRSSARRKALAVEALDFAAGLSP